MKFPPARHCEERKRRSNPFILAAAKMDRFASLAMTGWQQSVDYAALSISAKNSRAMRKLSTAAGTPP